MIPSEILRKLIEDAYDLPLSKYAWNDELKELIFSFKTDEYIESKVSSLKEAYEKGLNIGHCGTTSRYFSINFKDALMHVGNLSILKGTKHSTEGGHAWVEINGYILDPSLMILLPLSLKDEFGYHTKTVIAKDSSCMLSEYDTYTQELNYLEKDFDEYQNGLYIRK